MTLFHIYIGTSYRGCIRAPSPHQALERWAGREKVSPLILRVEAAKTVRESKMPSPKERAA